MELDLPAELALVARMIDRMGPRVRSIGGSIRWIVDGISWRLDLDVDGGRWLREVEQTDGTDAIVSATSKGVRALFGSAEDLKSARVSGEVSAIGDLVRLKAIGAALREGGSFITQLARRNEQ